MKFVHQRRVLERLIYLHGMPAHISRPKENEFHEPARAEQIGICKGLFHEANGYLGTLTVEAGKTYTAKQPMFLTMYTGRIQKEDLLEINGTVYRATGLDDLGNMHIFLDVSLEVL